MMAWYKRRRTVKCVRVKRKMPRRKYIEYSNRQMSDEYFASANQESDAAAERAKD